jgi:TfoX/Sxy family transcriptional regulator of competence genes
MASEFQFVEYVCEQAGLGPALSHRKMFGEYALYLDGKVVAFVCDNQLFVKPTDQGEALLGAVKRRPIFPGSKLYFQIGDELDDRDSLKRLLIASADALPMPKLKKAGPKTARPTAAKSSSRPKDRRG